MARLIDTKEGKIIIGLFIVILVFFLYKSQFKSSLPYFMVYIDRDSSFSCDLSKNLCEFHFSTNERIPAGAREFIKFEKYSNPFYYIDGHKCGYPHGLWIEADKDKCLEIGGEPDALICFGKKFKDICWIHDVLNKRLSEIDYKIEGPIGVSKFVKEGIIASEAYEDIRGFTISFTIPLTERKKITVYKLENNTCVPYQILEGDELEKDFYATLEDCKSNIKPTIIREKYYRYNQTSNSCEEVDLYPNEITSLDFKTLEECNSYASKKDKKYSPYLILIILIIIVIIFIWRAVRTVRAGK